MHQLRRTTDADSGGTQSGRSKPRPVMTARTLTDLIVQTRGADLLDVDLVGVLDDLDLRQSECARRYVRAPVPS